MIEAKKNRNIKARANLELIDLVEDRGEGGYAPGILLMSMQVVGFVSVAGFTRCRSVQAPDLRAVTAVSDFGFCSPKRAAGVKGISGLPPWSASDTGGIIPCDFSSPGGGGRSCVGLGIGINGNGGWF